MVWKDFLHISHRPCETFPETLNFASRLKKPLRWFFGPKNRFLKDPASHRMQCLTSKMRGIAACALAGACALSLAFASPARADETSIAELEAQVAKASQVYEDAMEKVSQLEASAAENQERITEIEAEIPQQKTKSAEAIRRLYKFGQNKNGLLELILSADDFNSFISVVSYLGAVQDANTAEANRLAQLKGELETTQAELEAQKAEAEDQREVADQALKDAEKLRDEAVAEAARKAAEEAARAAARSAAQEAVFGGDTSALNSAIHESAPHDQPAAQQAPETAPDQTVSANPNSSSEPADRESFIAEWTERIDAYLAGSPLEGYGYAFAEAACDYGVDPRWSPAISNTESSKGACCFRPYNAWGWGQASWPDWDTAIRAHVKGLAEGYGYTISEAAAQKYCPPNAHDWYVATASEMAKI